MVDFSVSGVFLSLNDPNAPNVFWGYVLFLNTNTPNAPNVFLDTFYS